MDNFFKTMKIRKVILVYAAVVIFFCIISELSFVKSTGILDENLFLLLCNLGVLVWFVLELRKVGCDIRNKIFNLKRDLTIKDITLSIIINITITIGLFIIIIYAFISLSPSLTKEILGELNKTDTSSLYSIIINGIAASFIAPVVEELIFRGVVLNRLKAKIGVMKAVVLSSILFGAIHYEVGMISAVVFGICMSLIYLKTKNIFVTISIHVINNFIVFVLQIVSFFIDNNTAKQNITLNSFNSLWLVLGIACFVIGTALSIYFVKTNWNKEITA
ncbi:MULTISPECIES: CPBP family intramembrane glutamic endopeptidase [Clostridium]|uniref:CAAX amino terminal protease self-immunity n=1 Tax=Clostridium ragsdalei P11 TaxID=1353534 RepID=A0A1A6ARD1_9CLOT|nr:MULTISPECIES: CPBP family intramembrane glutamic endopeptidase [Clostridium]OBR92590.1 CAAX amino terminal protease self- immunity [Clostridium ragsdalei P11]QXE21307.1 CPBP family intramembrane metalloprotease [Clostridium sp. 001]